MSVNGPPPGTSVLAIWLPAVALAVAVAGCPEFAPSGLYRCDTVADCPPGLACGPANLCVLRGDAGGDDPVDGGADAGDADGGDDAPDAGAPDAGTTPGTARVRFVNAGEVESHDFWLSVNGGVEQRATASLPPSYASEPLVVQAGNVTVFATTLSPVLGSMPFPLAQLSLTLAADDELAVTLTGGIGPGSTYALVRTDFVESGTRAAVASIVHASRGMDQFSLDTNDDGAAEATLVMPGTQRVLGSPLALEGPRFGFILGPGFTRYFSPFSIDPAGVVFVLSGRVDVPQHAPDSIRLIEVPRQQPASIVLNDAWVTGWNLLSPAATTELRIDGVDGEGAGVAFGELMGERQVPPKPISVALWRTDGTPQQLAVKPMTLARGEVLLAIAHGNPSNSADFVPFIDRTPRPVNGAVFNVVNATAGGLLPTLVVKSGATELIRDANFSAGKVVPADGAGRSVSSGTLVFTVSAAGLPLFDSSFSVAVAHGERLLCILEESGGSKPNLRVIHNLGPTQTTEVLTPD